MSCIEYSVNVSVSTNLLKPGQCFLLGSYGSGYSEVFFLSGSYKVELWGGSAGQTTAYVVNKGGLGGYTSGVINVHSSRTFHFYIGTSGTDSSNGVPGNGGYNGGSNGALDSIDYTCASGGSGGSTDMRLVTDNFGIEKSLLSRIMVAGGGGSAGCYYPGGKGGNAGGIIGSDGFSNSGGSSSGGRGGEQTSGYSLCFGGKGFNNNEAGGGGYWGGYGGQGGDLTGGAGGGGGSSYISGHPDCISLDNETKSPLGTPVHPSSFLFTDSLIIHGDSSMPSMLVSGLLEENGHEGSGAVRITLLSLYNSNIFTCFANLPIHLLFVITLQLLYII